MGDTVPPPMLPDEVTAHYGTGYEQERLRAGGSRVERLRTQILLRRYLPAPPARVLDVGGGPGEYAAWLAGQGYRVHLLDALPLHVDLAREAARQDPARSFTADVGDARSLPSGDREADVVLLFGPLYHLTDRGDREKALREAYRVLRPGGVLMAAAISRFASMLDGLWSGYVQDPAFRAILERDLQEGQHRNPDGHPEYFTTAFFHHPDELASEVRDAGLHLDGVLAIEGPGRLVPDLDEWLADVERTDLLLETIAKIEREPSLLGMSSHLMAVAHREG